LFCDGALMPPIVGYSVCALKIVVTDAKETVDNGALN